MQLKLPKSDVHNALLVMRRAGYSAFTDPVTKQESFVLRLTTSFYPRFHVYVKNDRDHVLFDVHLDQKQPSYGQGHMHAGEYEGPTVEREVSRIASWARAVLREEHAQKVSEDTEQPKKENVPKSRFLWFWNN